jgi:hypothetical protein
MLAYLKEAVKEDAAVYAAAEATYAAQVYMYARPWLEG